jgi:hypothetical protein
VMAVPGHTGHGAGNPGLDPCFYLIWRYGHPSSVSRCYRYTE